MDDKISLFDVRTVERNISEGKISKSDLDKHLKEIKDSSENADFETIGKDESEKDSPETESE